MAAKAGGELPQICRKTARLAGLVPVCGLDENSRPQAEEI